jgi:hypothetical protein
MVTMAQMTACENDGYESMYGQPQEPMAQTMNSTNPFSLNSDREV